MKIKIRVEIPLCDGAISHVEREVEIGIRNPLGIGVMTDVEIKVSEAIREADKIYARNQGYLSSGNREGDPDSAKG